jgi:hypothetical protein
MDWSREAESLLLYLETCAVDRCGRVEGLRMNSDDHRLADQMQSDGLLRFGRRLSRFISGHARTLTHWVELSDAGWTKANELRKARGLRNAAPAEERTESRLHEGEGK